MIFIMSIVILCICYIMAFLWLKKHSLAIIAVVTLAVLLLSYLIVLPETSEKTIKIIHDILYTIL